MHTCIISFLFFILFETPSFMNAEYEVKHVWVVMMFYDIARCWLIITQKGPLIRISLTNGDCVRYYCWHKIGQTLSRFEPVTLSLLQLTSATGRLVLTTAHAHIMENESGIKQLHSLDPQPSILDFSCFEVPVVCFKGSSVDNFATDPFILY